MSQDIVADTLNMMFNAIRAGKKELTTERHSKFLLSVLAIAKLRGYVKEYGIEGKNLRIQIEKLNNCGAIKPRFHVTVNEIEKYVRRYLPARHIGIVIISTSQGLMTHYTALEKNIGGSLIAYMY